MALEDKNKPDATSAAYRAMSGYWALAAALTGGTETLKAAGEKYLPQMKRETDGDYKTRLAAAVLTANMFTDAIKKFVSKVFSSAIVVEDEVKGDWINDIDLCGNNLNKFARDVFSTGVNKSMVHILVDHTRAEDGKKPRTQADDKAQNSRPYMVKIDPEDLIAAYAETVDGVETLTHVRYRVTTIERNVWGEKKVEKIYVREPGTFEIYTKDKDGDWSSEGPNTVSIKPISLVTFYADRKALMQSDQPLESIAQITKSHWELTSHYRNILKVSMFPILFASGIKLEAGEDVAVGPNTFITFEDAKGKLAFAEHTGAAIESGRKELLDLERKGSTQSDELLRSRGDPTAIGRVIGAAETNSVVQEMAENLEDVLQQALDYMALFAKIPTMGDVAVNKEFGADPVREDLDKVNDMYDRGIVSSKTVTQTAQRINILPDDYDHDADQEIVAKEATARLVGPLDDEGHDNDA